MGEEPRLANSRDMAPGGTRDCVDPWQYVEFRPNGDVGPCCVRIVGNLAEGTLSGILNGPRIRELRANLLRGTPDAICRSCGLRPETTPEQLRSRIESLLRDVRTPEGFCAESYLAAHPDVAAAGIDAAKHFLEHGRFEGRMLRKRDY